MVQLHVPFFFSLSGGEIMLKILLDGYERYDSANSKFIKEPDTVAFFEHSLVAVSKWESITKKPFITSDDKTKEEILLYIQCMYLGDTLELHRLSHEDFKTITDYISDKQSASAIKATGGGSKMTMTSEVIYAYMSMANIPYECENWNLNRLMNVIQVYGVLNQPQKKMSRNDVLRQNKALNEARKKQLNTRG